MSDFDARRSDVGVRFTVRLQPRASRNEIVGLHGGSLRIRLTAPPIEGMANEALIGFLSGALKVPRRSVCILSGLTSRTKIIEVRGVELEEVQQLAE